MGRTSLRSGSVLLGVLLVAGGEQVLAQNNLELVGTELESPTSLDGTESLQVAGVTGVFRKINLTSPPYRPVTVSVTGGVTMPDNPAGDPAEGVILFFDDGYDTRWAIVRAGQSITFDQYNWPYFYAGLIYHEESSVPSFSGQFDVAVTVDGIAQGTYAIDKTNVVIIKNKFRRIDLTSPAYRPVTVAVTGGVTMPDNPAGDAAEGVVLFFDDGYNTRWAVVRAGQSITFNQYNWPYFYAGLLYHEELSVPSFSGQFNVAVTVDGVAQGTFPIDRTHVAIIKGSGSSSSAVLNMSPAPLCSGQTVAIPVSISGGTGTQALEFDVVYDASKMTATGATAGGLTGGFSVSSNVTTGRIRVAMASGAAIAGSSGEVARVTFRGEAGLSPGSSTSISIQNVKVNDAGASGGSATVTCASCRRGDVNGNGSVSAYDASLILQAVVGAISLDSTQRCAADFNQNGSLTAYDASLILQCVVTGTCP